MSTSWGKVHGDLWISPKFQQVSPAARGVWLMALSYSIAQQSYGAVPRHLLPAFGGTPEDAAQLVTAGLWDETETGWDFHDWDDHQTSREHAERVHEARVEAGRKGGRKSRMRHRTTANEVDASRKSEDTAGDRTSSVTSGNKPLLSKTEANGSKSQAEVEVDEEPEATTSPALDVLLAPSAPTGAGVYPDAFELWWKAYPLKKDKRAALRAWRTATKRVPNERLIAAAEAYRDDPNRDDRFTKYPASWLNAEAWENGPLPPRGGGSGANLAQSMDVVAQLRAERAAQQITHQQAPRLEVRRTA